MSTITQLQLGWLGLPWQWHFSVGAVFASAIWWGVFTYLTRKK